MFYACKNENFLIIVESFLKAMLSVESEGKKLWTALAVMKSTCFSSSHTTA